MDYTFAVLLEKVFEFISEYINKYKYFKINNSKLS
jgi:hypothetical protein